MGEPKKETCLSCKVISISALFGIGSYLIIQGKRQTPRARAVLYTMGLGCIGLGVGEVFNKSPFRS